MLFKIQILIWPQARLRFGFLTRPRNKIGAGIELELSSSNSRFYGQTLISINKKK